MDTAFFAWRVLDRPWPSAHTSSANFPYGGKSRWRGRWEAQNSAGMELITLAANLGTSVKMLEDHYVKLSDDATGEIVEAHGFKLGLRPLKAAA